MPTPPKPSSSAPRVVTGAVSTSYQFAKAKGWDTTKKVSRSRKKVHALIDEAGHYLPGLPATATRPEILQNIVELLKHPSGPPRSVEHLLSDATAAFVDALSPKKGEILSVEEAWSKLLDLIQGLTPGIALAWDTAEYRNAFTWKLAGHIQEAAELVSPIENVLICRRSQRPGKGKRFLVFQLKNGDTTGPIPDDWEPEWPHFHWSGGLWRGKRLFRHAVANVTLTWPNPTLTDALRRILWEPSAKTLSRLSQKRARKSRK